MAAHKSFFSTVMSSRGRRTRVQEPFGACCSPLCGHQVVPVSSQTPQRRWSRWPASCAASLSSPHPAGGFCDITKGMLLLILFDYYVVKTISTKTFSRPGDLEVEITLWSGTRKGDLGGVKTVWRSRPLSGPDLDKTKTLGGQGCLEI